MSTGLTYEKALAAARKVGNANADDAGSAVLDDMGLIVANWIMSRADDPYQGVDREPNIPNLWYGDIPGTYHKGQVVCCSYWIEEQTHTVRCNMFSTLSWPV